MSYIVFSSYYKHGEVYSEVINSDEEMREFCLRALLNYYQYEMENVGLARNEFYDQIMRTFEDYPLNDLISTTIAKGIKRVFEQDGWGVRYVFRADNITTFEAANSVPTFN